jgi:hypothetical protein
MLLNSYKVEHNVVRSEQHAWDGIAAPNFAAAYSDGQQYGLSHIDFVKLSYNSVILWLAKVMKSGTFEEVFI